MTKHRAYVKVWGGDDGGWYWNPLAPLRDAVSEAVDDVITYREHKASGTGDFRKGAPGETKVVEVDFWKLT